MVAAATMRPRAYPVLLRAGTDIPLVLVVVVALTAGLVRGQEAECPQRCRSCRGDVVDCSSNSLTAPPFDYPDGTLVINLEGNHIRVLGQRSFRVLPSLQELKVGRNRISTLSNDAFGRPFPNLMTLDLTGNRINRIYRRALRGMEHLQTLKLDQNRITSLQRIFHGTPNLYQLNLARNRITRIGQNDLAPLTSVHYIDLRGNRIARMHPKAFKELDRLRYLFLNNNPLVRLSGLEWGSQVLQSVDLSNCKLTAVPKPMPASVTDLRLSRNEIRQVNYTDLVGMEDLRMLSLNSNQLRFVADGAFAHLTQLSEVWLRNNELVYVPRDLPNSVRRLHMETNNIQEIDTSVFAPNSQMMSFSVQDNRLNRIQPETFSNLRFLTTLNFQGNELRVLERDAFKDLGSLAQLLLSNNPLERIDTGAFSNLANLTTLLMAQLTSETFELEADFLPQMLRLQTLNLMGSPGLAQALMDKIETSYNTPLRDLASLDVSYNTLEYVPSEIRRTFPGIRSLLLDGNPLSCTQRLRWLRDWMVEEASNGDTGVRFYNYEEPTCDSPGRLRGRPVSSIGITEWASDGDSESGGNREGDGDWGTVVTVGGGGRGNVFAGGVASDQASGSYNYGDGLLEKMLLGLDHGKIDKDKSYKDKTKPKLSEARGAGKSVGATRVVVKYPSKDKVSSDKSIAESMKTAPIAADKKQPELAPQKAKTNEVGEKGEVGRGLKKRQRKGKKDRKANKKRRQGKREKKRRGRKAKGKGKKRANRRMKNRRDQRSRKERKERKRRMRLVMKSSSSISTPAQR